MGLNVLPEPIPLVTDADGVVRLGKTRVTLDTLVEAFLEGMSAGAEKGTRLKRGLGMQETIKSLGIDKLSTAERILLVEEIWDSILADRDGIEVPESHKAELDRRLASYNADPKAGSTWEDVKRRLQAES